MSYAFALYIAANPLHARDVDVADVAHIHQYLTIGAIVVRNACIALIAALMILMIAVVTAMADGRVKHSAPPPKTSTATSTELARIRLIDNKDQSGARDRFLHGTDEETASA